MRGFGNYDLAIADYSKAIEIIPTDAEAFVFRAGAYRAKGDVAGALADYDRAITLDPQNSDAYRRRGSLYQDKGDTARATADYDKADKVGLGSLLAPKAAK